MLEGMNLLNTPLGKVTVGVLIAQDFAFVPMMLILASLAGGGFGACLRHLLVEFFDYILGLPTYVAVMSVNVLGCFLIGLVFMSPFSGMLLQKYPTKIVLGASFSKIFTRISLMQSSSDNDTSAT